MKTYAGHVGGSDTLQKGAWVGEENWRPHLGRGG